MKEFVSTGGVYEEGYQRKVLPTTTDMTKNESFEKTKNTKELANK